MVADPPTAVSLGMHTLCCQYVKDAGGSVGEDCGWVDYVQWQPETLSYVYACPIRLSLRAGSEPAEWDPGRRPSSSNNQSSIILHHFPRLYGPSVDQPICMIEAAGGYAGTYYYRARYYHPEIGRFLQTDPIGYGDGMNLYRYCWNNPINGIDPTGHSIIVATGNVSVTLGAWKPAHFPWFGKGIGILLPLGEIVNKLSPSDVALVERAVFDALAAIEPQSSKYLWHAYVEIQDYNDTNGDGKMGEDDVRPGHTYADLFSNKRWVEVEGVLADSDRASHPWVPDGAAGGGYTTYEAACHGARTVYDVLEDGGTPKDLEPYLENPDSCEGVDLSKSFKSTRQLLYNLINFGWRKIHQILEEGLSDSD